MRPRHLRNAAFVALGLVVAFGLGSFVAPPADVALLLLGLVLLLGGAEMLVRGAVALAERLGIGSLLIGLTVVAFGTSAPELVVGLVAVARERPDFNIGNVVGSNIANIGLILGATALTTPFTISSRAMRRDVPVMILVTALAIAAMIGGTLRPFEGAIGLVLLFAYLSRSFAVARRESAAAREEREPAERRRAQLAISVVLVVAGLGSLVLGGNLLIESGASIARSFGVAEVVIGLSVVAIGTSLPELATCVVAALRSQPEIVVGNVVGSNIFNLLFVLGITSSIGPITIPPDTLTIDVWVMLAFAAAMPAVGIIAGHVTRIEGGVLVAAYLAYTVVRYTI